MTSNINYQPAHGTKCFVRCVISVERVLRQTSRFICVRKMIFLLITFFIYSRILFSVAFICFTLNNRLLPNKNFSNKNFSAIDWLQCIKACQNSPSCISFNYEVYNDKSCFSRSLCSSQKPCRVTWSHIPSAEEGTNLLILLALVAG